VVPADGLAEETFKLASRVAKTPPTLLALRKAAINQAAERGGFLETLRASAEWDALAHGDVSVAQTRELLHEQGIHDAIKMFES
jgi:enoyl-CoA hydratase